MAPESAGLELRDLPWEPKYIVSGTKGLAGYELQGSLTRLCPRATT